MSATIQVKGGKRHGTQFWIEEDVIRIGGDPSCNLIIPETAPQAVTLQFRNGDYWIYNRGGAQVRLDDAQTLSKDAVVWRPTQRMGVARGVSLHLLIDGNPAPCPAPQRSVKGFDDDQPAVEEDSAPSDGNLVSSLAIIGGCCLLILLMFVDMATADMGTRLPDHERFQLIVQQLQYSSGTATANQISPLLRQARYHDLRFNYDEAMLRYKTVRDILMTRRGADGKFANDVHADTYDFIKDRLAVIGPRTSVGGVF